MTVVKTCDLPISFVNSEARRLEVGRNGSSNDRRAVYLLTAQGYAALTGSAAPALQPGEAAVCGQLPPGFGPELTFQGISISEGHEIGQPQSLTVAETLPAVEYFNTTFDMFETLCLVVPDRAALMDLWALQQAALEHSAAELAAVLLVDLDCTNDQELALMDAWSDASMHENFYDGTGAWSY